MTRKLTGTFLSALLMTSLLVVAAPPVSAAPVEGVCNESTDVVFVGAAGSGQGQDQRSVGKQVSYMYEQLQARLKGKGYNVVFKFVDYPARSIFTFPTGRFLDSIDEGVTRAQNKLVQVVDECHDAKVILGGYSQGAMVWHKALNYIYDAPNSESNSKIIERLEGVILLADGFNVRNDNIRDFGTAGSGAIGISNWIGVDRQPQVKASSVTVNVCLKNDVVCDASSLLSSISVHFRYLQPRHRGGLDDAISWVDARFPTKPRDAQPSIKSAKVEFVNRDFLLTFNISTPAYLSWNFESDSYGTAGYYFACYFTDGRLNELGEPARWFASSGVIDRNHLRSGDHTDGQYVVDLERGIDPSKDIPDVDCQVNYAQLWNRESGVSIPYGVENPAAKTDPFGSVIHVAAEPAQ